MNDKQRPMTGFQQQGEQRPLSLIERLARHALARKGAASIGNRGLVTGLKKEIAKALDAGFSVKDVFRMLTESGQVKCSYQTFRLHVNALIGPKKGRGQMVEEPRQEEHVLPTISDPTPARASVSALPASTWNPTPDPSNLI